MKRNPLVLAAALAAAATTAGVAPAAASAACKTAALVVWVNTNGNAAAGSTYVTLEFTNQSGQTCSLYGYPGVSALDLHGHALGSPGGRNPSTVKVVRLADNATANAVLQIVVAANYPPATCHRTAAAALRVYPPGQKASKVVPLPFEACAHPGPVILHVKAVT